MYAENRTVIWIDALHIIMVICSGGASPGQPGPVAGNGCAPADEVGEN